MEEDIKINNRPRICFDISQIEREERFRLLAKIQLNLHKFLE